MKTLEPDAKAKFEARVSEMVERLGDDAGDEDMYPLVGLRLVKVIAERNLVKLSTEWDSMNFECLQHISKVFGTKDIDFTGQSVITYPYSEYTPIPVHTGEITLRDVVIVDDLETKK